ncbi:ankyrin repeat domain-containing protein [Chryseobacterium wangxinyae]|uniref:ankyrin repeat domain-containing protein n=1 Tax=Chryseobacterium sp. CY350 TaxID=2997336 RepID=UPI00226E745D|nr:ankyrin repeat domain-containing protein [Chryseobacterium sp. CY350]MCY0978867.1 ankyrin repeat domain-containing protein [Chryseobacterium sp. CY350]WBZ93756.1 ankyrin repeat domain-containing protein [Chryseobacterium sp. CY350]
MKKLILTGLFILSFCVASAQDKVKSVFDIARSGSLTELKDLMKQNPDVINETNDQKYSPLILACYRGNIEVADFLVHNVKDVNYNSPMGTALMAVIFKGDLKLAQKLLDNKSDINRADSNGTTPLIFAAKLGNIDMVKLLQKYKAEKQTKDNEGKTAFEYAVFSKNQELINELKK